MAIIMAIGSHAQFVRVEKGAYFNLEKYWWYRYRLVNDFMKVGAECGESIPAQLKAYQWAGGTQPDTMRIVWGDATQSLGHYIGTVAAESKLLSLYGWDNSRSNWEMYLGIKAFDRLDLNAEDLMSDMVRADPCEISERKFENSLNGFLFGMM